MVLVLRVFFLLGTLVIKYDVLVRHIELHFLFFLARTVRYYPTTSADLHILCFNDFPDVLQESAVRVAFAEPFQPALYCRKVKLPIPVVYVFVHMQATSEYSHVLQVDSSLLHYLVWVLPGAKILVSN